MKEGIVGFAIRFPWIVIGLTALITIFFAFQFPKIKIDTDPENMLPADSEVRLFDHQTKEDFGLSDFIAVGVVSEETAFTPDLLNRIYAITDEIKNIEGVIVDDILAPSEVDDIKQGEGGALIIEPLMSGEISTPEEAQHILARIKENPILRGKLASDDGKAIALFIPIESKSMSHRIAGEIKEITKKYGKDEVYHIAGLPVAEDSFGAEMFTQMVYSAPAAFLIIFLLMFAFFRNFRVVMVPMLVAIVTVIWSMGLLILTGNTVHIMSSMIPIFLIPIAVLNSIHIISEFHDRFSKYKHKDATIRHTIGELFLPLLFTSLTTIAGFASLATTPIPPVQVFGIFVAFGVLVSWALSLTLNPAIGILIPDAALRNFGRSDDKHGAMSKILHRIRDFSWKRSGAIIVTAVIVAVVSGVGLSMLEINDNPVKWFKKSHPIRQADIVMNQHLAGTYMNYLVVDAGEPEAIKSPEVQKYIESLQRDLEKDPIVGATTGVTDVVKKVRYELFGADSAQMYIPGTSDEVGQMLFMFEMSGGDPEDLFKFVTSDYDRANLWVQLRDGDNKAVSRVVERAEQYLRVNPPPTGIQAHWAGLPYINIEWQKQMVSGMRTSFLSTFVIVLIMMVILFRSIRWGLISMLPLTITVMAIYAFIGFIGKPYDMPVAILSALTLGLSIDFAIHFIERFKMNFRRNPDFKETYHEIFEGTGRAIFRNIIVIAIGFVPMTFSNLVPYVTVGTFFLAIMLVSGMVTLFLLPAIMKQYHRSLFAVKKTVAHREKVAAN